CRTQYLKAQVIPEAAVTDTVETSAVIATSNARRQPIAPWWHTVLMLAPIAIGWIASGYQHGLPSINVPGVTHRMSSYLTVLVEEWFGVFFGLAGTPKPRAHPRHSGFW